MSVDTNPMLGIIQKFLTEHFPEHKHDIAAFGNDFSVHVGSQANPILFFKVCGNSVHDVAIKKEHYSHIGGLFGLSEYSSASTDILNNFITALNENPMFDAVFESLKPIDFSQYLSHNSKHDDDFIDIYDKDTRFSLVSKLSDIKYPSLAQFSFRFTAENKLKCLPAIALIYHTNSDFRVAFNLEQQSTHVITSTEHIYENFFMENKLIDIKEDISNFVTDFVDDMINTFNSDKDVSISPFNLTEVSFKDKLKLLEMINI